MIRLPKGIWKAIIARVLEVGSFGGGFEVGKTKKARLS